MSSNKEEEKKLKNPYSKTLNEYASVSTAHGIAYIFEDGRFFVERVLWLIVVIAALTFAIWMSITAYHNWKDNPVLTSVKNTGLPIEKIDFPAITICSQGAANEIVDAALFQQFNDYLVSKISMDNSFESLSVEKQIQSFLEELYPGAEAPPNQLVSMMASPGIDPNSGIEALTIFNPEDKKTCSVNVDEAPASTPEAKHVEKRNTENSTMKPCPSGYEEKGNGFCVHQSDIQMDYAEAKAYCNSHSENSMLHQMKSGYEAIFDEGLQGKLNIYCPNSAFW